MSGMTQYIHKPFVMAFKAANLAKHDRQRAQAVFREAYNTLAMQFAYTGHALSRAKAAFIQGRPLLDRQQLKVDSNIRQGQLQRWLNASAELITTPLGKTGALMQKYLVEPTTYAVTTPLRTLGAGDEFLKQMLFKGRMAANIHETIIAKHPELVSNKWNAFKQSKEYKAKFKKVFLSKTRDEWCEIMEGTDICFAPVLSMDEAINHPHNKERNAFSTIDEVIQPSPAPLFSETPSKIKHLQNPIGEDTKEILDSIGWTEQIDDLISSNVIGCLLYTSPSPRDQRGSRLAGCG